MTIDRNKLHELTKVQLIDIMVGQVETINTLEARLAAFEKDSTTSSKPPSSDFSTVRTHSLREKSGKPSGGQEGHTGTTRLQVANPDVVIPLRPKRCARCGKSLEGIIGALKSKRQVADIPPINVIVREYRQEALQCSGCGAVSTGDYPDHIKAPFQIGENLKATVAYLNVAHHVPFERCTEILNDLLSVRISGGTVDTILTDASTLALPLYRAILDDIKAGRWTGGDETGTKVNGESYWQWVWQNERGSYYVIEPGRGYSVVEKHFGEDYRGTLVHDCWSAQNNTRAAAHQHCHPHYLRDLQFCIESERSRWAYEAQQFLLASERARDTIWQEGFSETIRAAIIQRYEERLIELTEQVTPGSVSRRIQKRMRIHKEKLLYFMRSPDIPFHNNSSERAIRNAKIHKKISGGFRSERGAQRHAVLLTLVETCKKRQMNILESLRLLFQGKLSFQGT